MVRASALAMNKVPEVNSSWMDSFVRQYNTVNTCITVGDGELLLFSFCTSSVSSVLDSCWCFARVIDACHCKLRFSWFVLNFQVSQRNGAESPIQSAFISRRAGVHCLWILYTLKSCGIFFLGWYIHND